MKIATQTVLVSLGALCSITACGIGRPPVSATALRPGPLPPLPVGPQGLPIPSGGGIAPPSGAAGNLVVLDWAGWKGAVSWTFDDAQPSHVEHYAELAAEGVPMTFYISSANGDESRFDATWTQAVKDGHELGNHAAHHCRADLRGCLSGAPATSLAQEVDACTGYITRHYPQRGVWTMAAPFGDSGYATVASSRFLVNRGIGSGMIAPRDATDPFSLPCYIASEEDSAGTFNRQTRLARNAGKWLIFLVHTLTPTGASWYAPVPVADVTAAMRYGRGLGDVWMGTVVDVAAYWLGQKAVAAARPSVVGTATTWRWELPANFPPGKYLRVTVDGGTLSQAGSKLAWDEHGYYQVALDAKELTLAP